MASSERRLMNLVVPGRPGPPCGSGPAAGRTPVWVGPRVGQTRTPCEQHLPERLFAGGHMNQELPRPPGSWTVRDKMFQTDFLPFLGEVSSRAQEVSSV